MNDTPAGADITAESCVAVRRRVDGALGDVLGEIDVVVLTLQGVRRSLRRRLATECVSSAVRVTSCWLVWVLSSQPSRCATAGTAVGCDAGLLQIL